MIFNTFQSLKIIHVHHIAVLYEVEKSAGKIIVPKQFEGQDSLGARWVSIESITEDNSSPLVCSSRVAENK